MSLDGILNILEKLQKKHKVLGRRINEATALNAWKKIVGPMIARHARPVKVKDNVLWVVVDHSIWKSELHHQKHQILERLNSSVPKKSATDDDDENNKQVISDILFLDNRPKGFISNVNSPQGRLSVRRKILSRRPTISER